MKGRKQSVVVMVEKMIGGREYGGAPTILGRERERGGGEEDVGRYINGGKRQLTNEYS